jgi:hypothetical protein
MGFIFRKEFGGERSEDMDAVQNYKIDICYIKMRDERPHLICGRIVKMKS